MQFKALALSTLAAFTLAACAQPTPATPEEAAAAKAGREAAAFDVTCYAPNGSETFRGVSEWGVQSGYAHVEINTLEGRTFEQYGGHCTALKRSR